MVRISGGQHDSHPNGTARANGLPAFWMEALIHSREWITGASMYWVIEAILEEYGTNDQITKVVDQMDLYCESCTPFTRRRGMHISLLRSTLSTNYLWFKARVRVCGGSPPCSFYLWVRVTSHRRHRARRYRLRSALCLPDAVSNPRGRSPPGDQPRWVRVYTREPCLAQDEGPKHWVQLHRNRPE